jgi:TonB family protein
MRDLLQAGLIVGALVGPAGAQPVESDVPKLAGSEVPSPKRKKLILPEYPEAAKEQGIRGIVLVELVIERDGEVGEATILRSIPALDDAALTAVRQWEYEPTKLDGRPVRVRLSVPITFSLKLPELTRQEGIPELRSGAAPAFPKDETALGKASVAADVSLDADGKVADILVTQGESPWADALVRAARTWVFESDGSGAIVSFKLEADFVRGTRDLQPRVNIRLSSPRRSETVEPPAMSGAAVPNVPAAPAASASSEPEPAAAPTLKPAPPIETIRVPKPPAAPVAPVVPAAAGSASDPSAPPPAPPAPRSNEPGYSSVRDVRLGAGVPDLAQGRRPIVPPFARLGHVAGSVTVEFSVGNSGVTLVSKVEGPEALKAAAQQMVASWQFRRTSTERLFMTARVEYGEDAALAGVTLAQ